MMWSWCVDKPKEPTSPVPAASIDTKRIDDALAWLVDIERGVAKVREHLLPLRASLMSEGDVEMAVLVQEWLDDPSYSTLSVRARKRFGAGGSKAVGEWLAKYSVIGPQIPKARAYGVDGTNWLEVARVAVANFVTIHRNAGAI
jgi:hypothetical protein